MRKTLAVLFLIVGFMLLTTTIHAQSGGGYQIVCFSTTWAGQSNSAGGKYALSGSVSVTGEEASTGG